MLISTAAERNLQSCIYTAVTRRLIRSQCRQLLHRLSPCVAVYIGYPPSVYSPGVRIDRSQALVAKRWRPMQCRVFQNFRTVVRNIRTGIRNIRPRVRIFQTRVQHSEAGSRFRGLPRKFQPGAEYLEPGYENVEPRLETFATDGTAYWHWQNGLTE